MRSTGFSHTWLDITLAFDAISDNSQVGNDHDVELRVGAWIIPLDGFWRLDDTTPRAWTIDHEQKWPLAVTRGPHTGAVDLGWAPHNIALYSLQREPTNTYVALQLGRPLPPSAIAHRSRFDPHVDTSRCVIALLATCNRVQRQRLKKRYLLATA